MKTFIATVLLISSFSSFAAEVVGAKLDANKKNILVDVRYGGGCKKHTFTLKLGSCMETSPVRCSSTLLEAIEDGFDACESIRFETVVLSLKKYGLTDRYFKGGSLTITGDETSNGTVSKATVTLP